MAFAPSSPLPRPASDVVDVEIAGERVIYRPSTDRVARLDTTGSLVWTLLDGRGSVAELGADLAHGFGIDPRKATADLLALLNDLESHGFLGGTMDEHGDLPDRRTGFLGDPPSP